MEFTVVLTLDQLTALERFIINNAVNISREDSPDDLRRAYGRIAMELLLHGFELSR